MLKFTEKEYSFETFVVGKANEHAFQTAKTWIASGCEFDLLFLAGNTGCGKTHLAKVVEHELKQRNVSVKMQTSEEFVSELIWYLVHNSQQNSMKTFAEKYEMYDVLILEDIHFLEGKKSTQEHFAYILERLAKKHTRVLMTSVKDVSEYKWLEEALGTSGMKMAQVQIQDADVELKRNILDRLQQEWCYELSEESADLMVNRAGDIRELEGMFKKMVAYRQLVGIDKNRHL